MQQTTVPYTAGRQSVSVEASGNWVLALYFQDDDQWASLSAESGSGSRNVVLEYGENNSEKERKVNIVLTASGTDVVLGFTQLPENSVSMVMTEAMTEVISSRLPTDILTILRHSISPT